MYAEVIVDIAHSQTDRIYDYLCPEGVEPGSRVRVPFGGREVEGFVVGVKEDTDFSPERIKPVEYVYPEPPALVPECFTLMRYISGRYRVPMASALRLFMPSDMRLGKVRELYRSYEEYVRDVPLSAAAVRQAEALEFVRSEGETEYTGLCARFGASAVRALEDKGALRRVRKRVDRVPLPDEFGEDEPKVLTAAQTAAIESIGSDPRPVSLIHGVTGSGKTEIYLNVIADALDRGKTAIFLVPEISLTPQMLTQLRKRFRGAAAILHSGLTPGERFDEWWRLRSGEARIAVGARSAIFAPLQNIGVIIMDEEHDSSYESESAPRYSTLEIAKMRAEYNGCRLVLGSATPSVESYIEASEGRYNLITLRDRINGQPMPEIEIADMRDEVRKGNMSPFSAALRGELEKTLESGNQAMLFLNRRGYSRTVMCQSCGYVAKCLNCDVTLTYHSEDNCLKCHYCGAKYRMLPACPECGGTHIRYSGTGTQRVVSELKALFPGAGILRMDNDSVTGRDGHYRILKQFSDRKADFLVGTQMIAKGHDFPAVTLVGVLDADMSLHFSDYRSGERTFQLITQVAGRSGRAGEKGKVVLQTCSPENYIIRYAANYDYEGFFENEVELRRVAKYPPYALIVRVMVTGEDDEACVEALKKVYYGVEDLRDRDPDRFLFLNRMRSPVKRIQNKIRYQVLMRLTDGTLLPELYDIAKGAESPRISVYVEENPANLS